MFTELYFNMQILYKTLTAFTPPGSCIVTLRLYHFGSKIDAARFDVKRMSDYHFYMKYEVLMYDFSILRQHLKLAPSI